MTLRILSGAGFALRCLWARTCLRIERLALILFVLVMPHIY